MQAIILSGLHVMQSATLQKLKGCTYAYVVISLNCWEFSGNYLCRSLTVFSLSRLLFYMTASQSCTSKYN